MAENQNVKDEREILIKVRNLKTWYPVKKGLLKRTAGYVKAVDDVSLDVYKGEILGVVGRAAAEKPHWERAFSSSSNRIPARCFTEREKGKT